MDFFDALLFFHRYANGFLGGFLYGFFRQRCCEIQLLVEEPMHANVRNNLYRSAVFAFGIYLILLIIFFCFLVEGETQIK